MNLNNTGTQQAQPQIKKVDGRQSQNQSSDSIKPQSDTRSRSSPNMTQSFDPSGTHRNSSQTVQMDKN